MISFYFAFIYWGGVVVNAVLIKKRTGKSPSLLPRLGIDYVLWPGWMAVIFLWGASPWMVKKEDHFFDSLLTDALGLSLAIAGVLGTWWCYRTLGNAWAISINKERTAKLIQSGPYRFSRHPIYTLQWMILAGLFLISPCAPLLASIVILSACMLAKAKVEERGLGEIFGDEYRAYSKQVGRFFPTFRNGAE